MRSLKMIFVLAIFGVTWGFSSVSSAKAEKDAIAKYNLSAQQATFMAECKSALSAAKKKFKNAGETEGCACMASEAGNGLSPAETAFASQVFRAFLATAHERNPTKFLQDYPALSAKANVAPERSMTILGRFLEKTQLCLKGASAA